MSVLVAPHERTAATIVEVGGEYVAVIPLANDRGAALIDAADLPLVLGLRWRLHTGGYAHTSPALYMHRRILDVPADVQVDHVNGHRLDNRRSNLRVATVAQQAMNRRASSATGFKGVSPHRGRYQARIMRDGRHRVLGCYSDAEEAARAYDAAAVELFGAFARLNFPAEVAS